MKNFDDSEHEIVFSERFEDGAVLHRFVNGGGVPYSAIYYGGYEAVSNKREEERDMIDYYREFHVPMRLEEQKNTTRTYYDGDFDQIITEREGEIHDLRTPIKDWDKGGKKSTYPFEFDPTFHRYRLKQLKAWHEPRVIFVCSMADLFGEWVPDEWIDEVFKACEEAPQHTYLFLTKNPSRYCQLDDAGKLPHKTNWWFGSTWTKPGDCVFDGGVGTIKERFNTFLSIEPLIAEPDITHGLGAFNWVIIGAETGNRKGKVTPKKEWVDKICSTYTAMHNPVFMKDSLVPIVGEGNMRREFPAAMKMALGVGK